MKILLIKKVKKFLIELSKWENKNLPEKGLKRIYSNVYKWIIQTDKKLADEFKSITKEFIRPL